MTTLASTSSPGRNDRNQLASPQRQWTARIGAAIWRAFKKSGHAQAQRQLLDFALQCETLQPELAKELRLAASHASAR